MILGKVIGTVVATRKEASMNGLTLLIVRQVDVEGKESSNYLVAVDAVGAGPGELVMVATGSSARQTEVTDKRPCDAVVMAIVDQWDLNGETRFRKTAADGEWAS
jgi:microcompartment protein CcmK/EutM